VSFHRRLALSSCPVVGAGQTIHESNRNVKHIFDEFFIFLFTVPETTMQGIEM